MPETQTKDSQIPKVLNHDPEYTKPMSAGIALIIDKRLSSQHEATAAAAKKESAAPEPAKPAHGPAAGPDSGKWSFNFPTKNPPANPSGGMLVNLKSAFSSFKPPAITPFSDFAARFSGKDKTHTL